MTYFEGGANAAINDGMFLLGLLAKGPNSLPRGKSLDEKQFQVD